MKESIELAKAMRLGGKFGVRNELSNMRSSNKTGMSHLRAGRMIKKYDNDVSTTSPTTGISPEHKPKSKGSG